MTIKADTSSMVTYSPFTNEEREGAKLIQQGVDEKMANLQIEEVQKEQQKVENKDVQKRVADVIGAGLGFNTAV